MSRLDDVYADIAADEYWDGLRLPGINFVPGYGQRNKPIAMILGEAPGATENARLRPFCGPSGQVLNHLMETAGLRLDPLPEEDLASNAFLTNVVKYRPPGNRTPTLGEIWHAKEGFKQERLAAGFKKVVDRSLPEGAGSLPAEYRALGSPPVIICIGGTAFNAVHPMAGLAGWNVSEVRRIAWNRKHEHVPLDVGRPLGGDGPWFLTSWHPAYGLRKGMKIQEIMTRDWERFGKFMQMEGIL